MRGHRRRFSGARARRRVGPGEWAVRARVERFGEPALLLLLISAVLHTSWNLLIKQAEDKYIVTWWMVTIGGIFAIFALF